MSLDPSAEPGQNSDVDLLGLDAALSDLATLDERKAQAVTMRFFGARTVSPPIEGPAIKVPVGPRFITAAPH